MKNAGPTLWGFINEGGIAGIFAVDATAKEHFFQHESPLQQDPGHGGEF